MGLNGISRVHILGGAQTDFARNWSREGKGAVALLREVLDDGLTAAGVTDEDIRALNGAGRGCLLCRQLLRGAVCPAGASGCAPDRGIAAVLRRACRAV